MEKRKNGKRYNTDTATFIKEIRTPNSIERLYLKPNAREFFLYTEMIVNKFSSKQYTDIIPLEYDSAEEWGREHLSEKEFKYWFPDFIIREKKGNKVLRQLRISVNEEYFNLIKTMKAKTGKTTSEILIDLVENYLEDENQTEP